VIVRVRVPGRAQPLARPLVRLVAALDGDQPATEDRGHRRGLVGAEPGVPAADVDADLALPPGGAQQRVQPPDVGRSDDVLHPLGQRIGGLLPLGHPEGVAVERVAGDAQVARAQRAQQRGGVALGGVEVADAELTHLEGEPDEVGGQPPGRLPGVDRDGDRIGGDGGGRG
jgi:hypothetical protein